MHINNSYYQSHCMINRTCISSQHAHPSINCFYTQFIGNTKSIHIPLFYLIPFSSIHARLALKSVSKSIPISSRLNKLQLHLSTHSHNYLLFAITPPILCQINSFLLWTLQNICPNDYFQHLILLDIYFNISTFQFSDHQLVSDHIQILNKLVHFSNFLFLLLLLFPDLLRNN